MGYNCATPTQVCSTTATNCTNPVVYSYSHPTLSGVYGSMGMYHPICCAGVGCGIGAAVGLQYCNHQQLNGSQHISQNWNPRYGWTPR